MPSNRQTRVPSYRRHKPTGQAVVTLSGKDHYLGRWNSAPSRAEYNRLIGEWFAGGCDLLKADPGITVAELANAYWKFAKVYYRKDGEPTGSVHRVRVAVRTLRKVYGYTLVRDFGPLALQAIQVKLATDGKSRRYVNYLVDQVRRIVKWGVAQELVAETVYRALCAVNGLRKGRSAARETEPIRPVADETVDATLPHLPPIVADMVRLQRLTGCRPGEVCIVRPVRRGHLGPGVELSPRVAQDRASWS